MRRIAGIVAIGLLALAGCKGGGDDAKKTAPTTPQSAAEPVPAPAAASGDAKAVTAQPFLWKVQSKTGSAYLFGTMHLGVSLHADVNPIVLAQLADAKTFVMEADVSKVDGQELMGMAKLPDGKRLDGLLSPERWAKLKQQLSLMSEADLVALKPWFVIVNLSQSILPTLAPMDSVLRSTAEGNGAKVAFLETWQYQIELLDDVMGADDLGRMVDDFDDTKKDMLDLAAAYKRGDADAVAKLVFDPEEYEHNPKVVDVLLVRRNKEWMPHIEKYATTGDAFIAVGLGHLIGEHGVLAMLRERGYEVTRVE